MSAPCEGCQPDPAKNVTRVRVWYADATMAEGEDWAAHPRDGVVAVRLDYADGTGRVMDGRDWYFTAPSPTGHGRIYGSTDHKADIRRYRKAVALRGAWTDDATYAAIERAATQG